MPENSISDGPITNLLSVLCILLEVLSLAHAKVCVGGVGGGGACMISNLAPLLVIS